MRRVLGAAALIVAAATASAVLAQPGGDSVPPPTTSPPSSYDYPGHCLHYPFPSELRAAPPLEDQEFAKRLLLDHVHLVFRHGARTPMPLGQCWANFEPHWDCDYAESIQGGLGTGTYPSDSHTLSLTRRFDAHATDNNLGGTCQSEQLLTEGAQQHQRIGRLVAENYLISGSERKLPLPGTPPLLGPSLKLLSGQLYLRSTETARSTSSLLNQLQSMLAHFIRREILGANTVALAGDETAAADNPKSYPPQHRHWTEQEIQQELDLHEILKMSLPALNTMDGRFDPMTATAGPCPLVNDIAREVVHSADFRAIRAANVPIIEKWQNLTGLPLHDRMWPVQPFDCAMTHVCADRWDGMPQGLHPQSSDAAGARQFLTDLERAATSEIFGLYTLSNAVFSRFGIGTLVNDIRNRMLLTLQQATDDPKRTRLHLWSTHDDGVAPLLFAVTPTFNTENWIPLASLVTVEVYRLSTEARLRAAAETLFPYNLAAAGRGLQEEEEEDEAKKSGGNLAGHNLGSEEDDDSSADDPLEHVHKDEAKLRDEEDKKVDKDAMPPFPGYYVRLIFNGQVITPHAVGCSGELCPLDDFFKGTSWAAAVDRLCADARKVEHKRPSFIPEVPYPPPDEALTEIQYLAESEATVDLLAGPTNIVSATALGCVAVVGALVPVTALLLKRTRQRGLPVLQAPLDNDVYRERRRITFTAV